MTGVWEGAVRTAAARQPLAVLGPNLDAFRHVQAVGATIRAAVVVTPVGAPAAVLDEVPVQSLPSRARSVGQMQVEEYASTLERRATDVAAFLETTDPTGEASVVSLLPAPRHVAQGRSVWAPEPELARALERKRTTGAPLASVVPWLAGEPAPARSDASWWDETTERLGTTRLVLQRADLNAAGEATWICESWQQADVVVADAGPAGVRVTPYAEGWSANVMAAVVEDDVVLVLPPSRQLVMEEPSGQLSYAGNVVGGPWSAGLDQLEEDARTAARTLATMGYRGVFGLDGIVDADGVRYHDLNARLNGAVHALNAALPVFAGLMLLPAWLSSTDIAAAEAELRAAVNERPVARWRVTMKVGEDCVVGSPPRSGHYRLDPEGPDLRFAAPDGDPGSVGGSVALVRARVLPGTAVTAGDRLDLADLWCDAQLSDALLAHHGNRTVHALASALLDAGQAR